MPDFFDSKKALDFVLTFLPGFVTLALAQSITDLELTDLEFVYVGITLSVLIALPVRWTVRLAAPRLARWFPTVRSLAAPQEGGGESEYIPPTWLTLCFSIPPVIITAILVGAVTDNDLITQGMRKLTGSTILSHSNTFYYLMKHNQRCTLTDVSPREYTYVDGREAAPPDRHRPWVLVKGKDAGLYEGHPRFFSTTKGDNPQIYLAPACRVTVTDGIEKHEPIPGNGILVTEIAELQFVDVAASACATIYNETTEVAVSGAKCPEPLPTLELFDVLLATQASSPINKFVASLVARN